MVGMVVNTNMDAITIENILSNTNSAVSSSLTKLSSGIKINSAADDPSGFAVANSFAAKIAAMNVASQNASEAQSMLQTADGAYSQINDILVQMKSLATEAASGQTDNAGLTGEFTALQNEITTIANSTQYGNINLLSASGETTGQAEAQYASDVSQIQTWAGDNSSPDQNAAEIMWAYFDTAPFSPDDTTLTSTNAGEVYNDLSNFEQNPFAMSEITPDVANILSNMISLANTVSQEAAAPAPPV